MADLEFDLRGRGVDFDNGEGTTELDLALCIGEPVPLPVVQYSYTYSLLTEHICPYFFSHQESGTYVRYLSSISYHREFAASDEGSNSQHSAYIKSFKVYTDSNRFCSLT